MQDKPVIAVTGPDKGGLVAWTMTAFALWRCGARALRVTPGRTCDEQRLDAVVIGGGTDVDPLHYGEKKLSAPENGPGAGNSMIEWLVGITLTLSRAIFATRSGQDYDPDRDQMERHLIEYALYKELPVLGICRGAQLINVVLGGSLHQKIDHFYSEETHNVRSVLPSKTVKIDSNSHLRRILKTDACRVNALHNQSIKKLGREINVSAVEDSGIVQAVERAGKGFCIGVQWHPEYMPQSKTQRRLFHNLVQHALRHKARPGVNENQPTD